MKRLFFLFLILLMCGCTEVATVASTGGQALYNHNMIKETLDDHYITMKAYQQIYNEDDNRFKNTSVAITTFHNEVLMTGEIPDAAERAEMERLIRQVKGIKRLYNLTIISPPLSPIVQASDAWITGKVKTKIIAMENIDPGQIKVVTENGTVFLMGIVTHDQANRAVQLARTTDGVQSVVKIFYYLTISKT